MLGNSTPRNWERNQITALPGETEAEAYDRTVRRRAWKVWMGDDEEAAAYAGLVRQAREVRELEWLL